MKLVFVSSTFKDMQFERDLLQTYAIPTLNEALREYGERAYFGDLRWGVNTTDLDSEEGSRKVLKVCLDQIDHCKPYMIVLVGERYGWIPAQELIDEACVLKGIEKIRDVSVTELEIDYGALLNPEYEGRILFYFRSLNTDGMTAEERRGYEAESDLHREKVEELKRRIGEIYPDHIRYYDAIWDAETKRVVGLENFLSLVEKDLSAVLLGDLESDHQIPWQERCAASADRWLRETEAHVLPEGFCFDVEYQGIEVDRGEGAPQLLFIAGEAGSGKTSFLSRLYASDASERKLAFVFGLDKYSTSEEQFLRVLIYRLETLAKRSHDDLTDATLTDLIDRVLKKQETVGDCTVYVDNASESFLTVLSLLEQACLAQERELRLSFRIVPENDLPFYPFFHISSKVRLGGLGSEEARTVLDGIVKGNRKELSLSVKEHILSKEHSGSAAYLRSIVQRLMMLDSEDFSAIRAMGDGMENINKYMIGIVDETADDVYGILLELIDEAKERINNVFVDRLMSVLTYVPLRLSAEELGSIFRVLGWDFGTLDFMLAMRMLEDVVTYYPETAFYGIKNEEIRARLRQRSGELDLSLIAEYMMTDAALRPHAYRVAIHCEDPALLHRVVVETKTEDITRGIRELLRQGKEERARELIFCLAAFEETRCVKTLPDLYVLGAEEKGTVRDFLWSLYDEVSKTVTDARDPRLYPAISAALAALDDLVQRSWVKTIQRVEAVMTFLQSITDRLDVELGEQLTFILLKAVNESKSLEVYESYIKGEDVPEHFPTEDTYQKTVLKMKMYYELYEIMRDVADAEKASICLERAQELYDEVDFSVEMKPEDYFYFARIDGTWDELLFGRALFPLSTEMLRYEILLSCDTEEDSAGERGAYGDPLDRVKKSRLLLSATDAVRDAHIYLRVFADLVGSEAFEELDAETLSEYFDNFIELFETLLEEKVLPYNDYALLLPIATILARYEGFEDRVESLLAVADCKDPLCSLIGTVARILIDEETTEEELASVQERYAEAREKYCEVAQIALNLLEYYLSLIEPDTDG